MHNKFLICLNAKELGVYSRAKVAEGRRALRR